MVKIRNEEKFPIRGRYLIYALLAGVIIIGGLIPFFAQFCLPIFYPTANVAGAEVWNVYVSIILGIVATVTSIVSLILGFKASDDTLRSQLEISNMINQLSTQLEVMKVFQSEMNDTAKALERKMNDGFLKKEEDKIVGNDLDKRSISDFKIEDLFDKFNES